MNRTLLIVSFVTAFGTARSQSTPAWPMFAGGDAQRAAEAIVGAVGRAFGERFRNDSLLSRPIVLDTVPCDGGWSLCRNLPSADAKSLVRAFARQNGGSVQPAGQSRLASVVVTAPHKHPSADTAQVAINVDSPTINLTGAMVLVYTLVPRPNGEWVIVGVREWLAGAP